MGDHSGGAPGVMAELLHGSQGVRAGWGADLGVPRVVLLKEGSREGRSTLCRRTCTSASVTDWPAG